MTMAITEAELLEALASSTKLTGDGQTMKEIVRATGLKEPRIRKALLACHEQGRLIVHRVMRSRLDGAASVVPAYVVLPAKVPRKKKG